MTCLRVTVAKPSIGVLAFTMTQCLCPRDSRFFDCRCAFCASPLTRPWSKWPLPYAFDHTLHRGFAVRTFEVHKSLVPKIPNIPMASSSSMGASLSGLSWWCWSPAMRPFSDGRSRSLSLLLVSMIRLACLTRAPNRFLLCAALGHLSRNPIDLRTFVCRYHNCC